MSTWAPNTTRVIDNGLGRARVSGPITGAWEHHQADGASGDRVEYMAHPNNRNSHPTYATDDDGNLIGIVHPDRAPSSTFYWNDQQAITGELANSSGPDEWRIKEKSLREWAKCLAHHAIESPRKNVVVRNKPGVVQEGFWLGVHLDVVATACPGPYAMSKLDWTIKLANDYIKELTGKAPDKESTPEPPKPGKGSEKAPAFPMDPDWWYGPRNGPMKSVSGFHSNAQGTLVEHQRNIARFQRRMIARGWLFPKYGADGLYGDELAENTLAFQKEKRLKADSRIGPETWAAAWEEPIT